MANRNEADVAALYHLHSRHLRGRPIELPRGDGDKALAHRTYPGSPRIALAGRDFALDVALGQVLERRRSVREHAPGPIPWEVFGRLLHASYGAKRRRGGYRRSAPSAGGLYPIELHVAVQGVERLPDGIYHYDARAHELEERRRGNVAEALFDRTLGQAMVRTASVVFALTAVRARNMGKYGQRGYRFQLLDAGHLGQNLYLTATALGLGAAGIGGFYDTEVNALFALPEDEETLYLIAVGKPLEGGEP
jgi:SagB-type dehydrogenase family enzyme